MVYRGRKDDPSISLIKETLSEGYYWEEKHGNAIAFLKMAASVMTGKTMDDRVVGVLDL